MVNHVHCYYAEPWIGDVPLLSALWHDDARGIVSHVAVPVVDGQPWWGWAQNAPEAVQECLRNVWARENGRSGLCIQ